MTAQNQGMLHPPERTPPIRRVFKNELVLRFQR